jgi:hypothetical protein
MSSPKPTVADDLSADALRIAAAIEAALADGRADALAPEAVQALMAAACKTYTAGIGAGQQFLPVGPQSGVTSTDVMTTASGLLRAADLQVFELGMWQSWTGR